MTTPLQKYPPLTREQRQTLYEEWQQSGETQTHFLARKQRGPNTFKSDLKKTVRSPKKPTVQFLPVQLKTPVASMPTQKWLFELPGGAQIHFWAGSDSESGFSLLKDSKPC